MRLVPYLSFNGDCQAAFRLYAECLQGEITFQMTFAQSPMAAEVPPEWRSRIFHVTLAFGDQILQGADAPPGQYQKPQGITVSLDMQDTADADRVYSALSAAATVHFPLQKTDWAERLASFTDRFGTPWLINCGK